MRISYKTKQTIRTRETKRFIRTKSFTVLFSSIAIAFSLVSLSGCAQMSAPPKCSDGSGLTCARVDQINHLVDTGTLSYKHLPHPVHASDVSEVEFNTTQHPAWASSVVLPIWIAPYEDRYRNYHQASEIDTVIKPGHWAVQSTKMQVGQSHA